MAVRDLKLGSIDLVTLLGVPTEGLGATVEVSGGTPVAGQPAPVAFSLEIPVYGGQDESNPYTRGLVLRRALRSLLNNTAARTEGIYMQFARDSELNAWLIVGKADLAYGDGGITLADFKLTLAECYVLGRRRTHRPARRCEFYTLGDGEIARDVLGRAYSSAFAGFTALPLGRLPSGATDVWLNEQEPVSPATLSGLWTDTAQLWGRTAATFPHASILSFEQPEASENVGDARIFDRKGLTAPTLTLAGDKDPSVYGWEQVYGPDFPLTAAEVPALDNGVCRLTWNATQKAMVVEFATGGAAYVEVGRLMFRNATEALVAPTNISVHSWTRERATIRFDVKTATQTQRVYVTLARGWTGPKVDCYITNTSGTVNGTARWAPFNNGAATVIRAADCDISDDTTGYSWNDTAWWTVGAADEPWFMHHVRSQVLYAGFVPADSGVVIQTIDDTLGYGSTRKAVEVRRSTGVTTTGPAYYGFRMNVGVAHASWELEAEAWINSGGTRTLVADANASPGSGNSAVNDTQTAETAATVIFTNAGALSGLAASTYGLWARVRIQTGTGTLNARGYYGASPIAAAATSTTTGTSFYWLYLGDWTKASSDLSVRLWGTGGVTACRIDRIALVPGADDSAALTHTLLNSTRTVAATAMLDSRMVPTLVSRGL